MFEAIEANMSLMHKNERIEKHGEEQILACDLRLEWETGNGVLAMFDPALRSALYRKDEDQGELIVDVDHLTVLKFAGLPSLKWVLGELVGAEVTFHAAVSKNDLVLEGCKVHKFRIDCKDGGTVVISFQVQAHPTELQSGKLSRILTDKLCQVSVIPPSGESHGDSEE